MTLHEFLDYLIRLLPGGTIVAAIIVARSQLRAARRATAITIAKNYYRELITICLYNADVTYRGATPEGLAALKREPANYRRYRWLVTQALFALQEIYFAIPGDPYWRRTICVVSSSFKAFILSPDEIPERQRAGWHPEFMAFVMTSLKEFDHPVVTLRVQLGEPESAGDEALHRA